MELNVREKEIFCKLANYLICVDGIIAEQELATFEAYNQEMNYNYAFDNSININLKELTMELSDSSARIKKIICFELLALAHADSNYSSDEHSAIDDIRDLLNITPEDRSTMSGCIYQIMETYSKLGKILNN